MKDCIAAASLTTGDLQADTEVTGGCVWRRLLRGRIPQKNICSIFFAQYANGMQELMMMLQQKEEAVAASFPDAGLVVRDQFLLGMKNPMICQTPTEQLKLMT